MFGWLRLGFVASAILSVAACGGGGGGSGSFPMAGIPNPEAPDQPSQTVRIGGSAKGLWGPVTLKQGGGESITIAADGAFNFAQPVTVGSTYDVTVASQPLWQHCALRNGSGTASSNVTSIEVECSSPSASVSTFAGSSIGYSGFNDGPGAEATFLNPFGVTVDSAGRLLVADRGNSALRHVSRTGEVTTRKLRSGYVNRPEALTVTARNEVFAISGSNTLYKIVDDVATEVDLLSQASGAAAHGDRVYVADLNAGEIYRYEHGKGREKLKLSRQIFPAGIAVDPLGTIYVADQATHSILKITNESEVSVLAGSGSRGAADGMGTSASFNAPRGLAVGPDNNVYVADTFNHVIRMVSPTGSVITLAGSPTFHGHSDGNGAEARFDYPSGLTVLDGAVYVADTDNHSIRKLSSPTLATGRMRP